VYGEVPPDGLTDIAVDCPEQIVGEVADAVAVGD
jgi:hypothetical protein